MKVQQRWFQIGLNSVHTRHPGICGEIEQHAVNLNHGGFVVAEGTVDKSWCKLDVGRAGMHVNNGHLAGFAAFASPDGQTLVIAVAGSVVGRLRTPSAAVQPMAACEFEENVQMSATHAGPHLGRSDLHPMIDC